LLRFFIVYWDEPAGPACPLCGDVRVLLPPTGRCARCRVHRGPPAGSVEFASAAVLAMLGRPLWCLGLLGVCLAFADARVHRLPNPLTLAFFGLALLAVVDADRLRGALLGAGAATAVYLVLVLAGGFGMGDAKLAAGLGLLLGALGRSALVIGVAAGFVLSGLVAAGLLVARQVRRRTRLAHGPFMLAGALLAVVMSSGPAVDPDRAGDATFRSSQACLTSRTKEQFTEERTACPPSLPGLPRPACCSLSR
jgi:leader peptidase (prepilin peptidase)/N-methyltransferase